MALRVDQASRRIGASPRDIYAAFSVPGAMEQWLPPGGMGGEMLDFDFREGGSYRMRLTYGGPHEGHGKTSGGADEVHVRLTRLDDGRRIEQEVTFESEDPAFSGVMRMAWTFQPEGAGTLVTVCAGDVPRGIRKEEHQVGLDASLANLAAFVERAR